MLGAFEDAEWKITNSAVEPGQQLIIVTDGVTEAQGSEGRFGEARLHSELRGASNPAMAMQRLERSLHAFTDGGFTDDIAMLAISRASRRVSGGATVGGKPTAAVLSLDNVDV